MNYPIGTRVEVVDAVAARVGENPTPQHIGRQGVLTGEKATAYKVNGEVVYRGSTPEITLDNGDIVYGDECWWKPLDPPGSKEA